MFPIVGVVFFYSSMSILEGKPKEVIPRVEAVRLWLYLIIFLFSLILDIRIDVGSQLASFFVFFFLDMP
jgi:hypothetical protein